MKSMFVSTKHHQFSRHKHFTGESLVKCVEILNTLGDLQWDLHTVNDWFGSLRVPAERNSMHAACSWIQERHVRCAFSTVKRWLCLVCCLGGSWHVKRIMNVVGFRRVQYVIWSCEPNLVVRKLPWKVWFLQRLQVHVLPLGASWAEDPLPSLLWSLPRPMYLTVETYEIGTKVTKEQTTTERWPFLKAIGFVTMWNGCKLKGTMSSSFRITF